MREQRHGRGGPRHLHDEMRGGRRWGRGGRMRRGDIRTALLAVLDEAPGHGYELIQRIDEKSGGAWRPSPGSVYPTLQLLEDEGLVSAVERDAKRVYEITDAGRAEAARRIEEAGGAPWAQTAGDGPNPWPLRESIGMLALAVKQVALAGNNEQIEKAVEIVTDARKKLYQLLSEG
jgi:DNA-binding PadR family transcriptional regulator